MIYLEIKSLIDHTEKSAVNLSNQTQEPELLWAESPYLHGAVNTFKKAFLIKYAKYNDISKKMFLIFKI